MSEHPRSMDEFAAGMREAAAERAEQMGLSSVATRLRTHLPPHAEEDEVSDVLILEAAIAYVREHFEFVEVWPGASIASARANRWYRVGVASFDSEGAPALSVMMPKPAPEPKPDVWEALRVTVEALDDVADSGAHIEHAREVGRAALNAE